MRTWPSRVGGTLLLGTLVEPAQMALFVAGWVVAFLLGRELRAGYVQWRQRRRR
ncbi:MAG: hypothetical protein HY690_02990 [Chloroflexi bacterium]|nr:hypothetical protein [Chloroflexota bacterium]